MKSKEPKILVVDDQPINVRLLEKKLQRCGMSVISAFNGPEALAIVEETIPDVILLDIMMPGMDGLEVCRRIKETPHLRDVPIIFITAKTSKEGKIEGLGMGASDYITKPIDLDETVARISTQLRIQEQYRANLELSERLADSRKRAAVAQVTEGIAHNLNNLLGVVVGYVDLLKNMTTSNERTQRSFDQLERAVGRMVAIVRELTTIAEFDRVRKSPYSANMLVSAAIDRYRVEQGASANTLSIALSPLDSDVEILTNAELLEDVISRTLRNAVESYRDEAADRDQEVEIKLDIERDEEEERSRLLISILDRGTGIPARVRENVFEPFVTTASAIGRGMGLTIARHSMQALGGHLDLLERPGGGTVAVLGHPLEEKKTENGDGARIPMSES
ncbi:MAG: response regulator [Opitutales bacterium]|nr:response regulator [Opitutales bacterium]